MGEVGGRLEKVNVPGVGVAAWKEACLKLFILSLPTDGQAGMPNWSLGENVKITKRD